MSLNGGCLSLCAMSHQVLKVERMIFEVIFSMLSYVKDEYV